MGNKTLTRADLADAVVRRANIPRHEAQDIVEMVLAQISGTLERGEGVKLSSFGSFGVREKNERIGRNPKTGEEKIITPRRVLVFKASNVMKEKVNRFRPNGRGTAE
ncbi:MAG: integration host factor subunit alpha [Hyphomicrobiaceae bacterium]